MLLTVNALMLLIDYERTINTTNTFGDFFLWSLFYTSALDNETNFVQIVKCSNIWYIAVEL